MFFLEPTHYLMWIFKLQKRGTLEREHQNGDYVRKASSEVSFDTTKSQSHSRETLLGEPTRQYLSKYDIMIVVLLKASRETLLDKPTRQYLSKRFQHTTHEIPGKGQMATERGHSKEPIR